MQLLTCLGSIPKPVHIGFVVDKVAMGQILFFFLPKLEFLNDHYYSNSVLCYFIRHRCYIIPATDIVVSRYIYKGILLQGEKKKYFRTETNRK